jgi:uracil phosphoribosyltransferase
MVEAAQSLLPEGTPVYHLGIYREPSTLQATEYYSRLPLRPTVEYIFVLDPLLATGGTAIAAVKSMVSWGVKEENITLICILATSTGLSNFRGACPTANVVVATANDSLNALGRAVPGLGDVGDRLYGTTVE